MSSPLESVDAMIHFKPESVVDRIVPRAALWIYPEDDTVVPVGGITEHVCSCP